MSPDRRPLLHTPGPCERALVADAIDIPPLELNDEQGLIPPLELNDEQGLRKEREIQKLSQMFKTDNRREQDRVDAEKAAVKAARAESAPVKKRPMRHGDRYVGRSQTPQSPHSGRSQTS